MSRRSVASCRQFLGLQESLPLCNSYPMCLWWWLLSSSPHQAFGGLFQALCLFQALQAKNPCMQRQNRGSKWPNKFLCCFGFLVYILVCPMFLACFALMVSLCFQSISMMFWTKDGIISKTMFFTSKLVQRIGSKKRFLRVQEALLEIQEALLEQFMLKIPRSASWSQKL